MHSFEGIFAVADGHPRPSQHLAPLNGIDIGATVLKFMGVDPPARMQGRPMQPLLDP